MKKIFFSLVVLVLTQLSATSISIGDEVAMVADKVKVRSCAGLSCSSNGRVSISAIGRVVDGSKDKDGYYWWKIDWDDDSPDGWTPTPKSGYSWYYEKPSGLRPGGSSSSPEIVNSTNPTLRWNKIDGVHHYLVSLLEKTDNGTKIIKYYDNISGSKTSFTIPDSLEKGKRYLWSIMPFDDGSDMGLKADYVYIDILKKAKSNYDLTIRPNDITINSRSGDDNIINVGEKFNVRVNIRNIGDADSSRYKVRYYYKSSSSQTFTQFDTDSNSGTDAGSYSSETSDNKMTEGTAGTHYVRVCVYDNEQDSDHNNDCGLKSFEVKEKQTSGSDIFDIDVNPDVVNGSFTQRIVEITGKNLKDAVLKLSYDNSTDFSNVDENVIEIHTDTLIRFKQYLFSFVDKNKKKVFYKYNYKVTNGNNDSKVESIQVNYVPLAPIVLLKSKKYTTLDNSKTYSIKISTLDLEDILIKKLNNYKLYIDWGEHNGYDEEIKNYNKDATIIHTYKTQPSLQTYTVKAYAVDSDGNSSNIVQTTVVVKGSKSKSIEHTAFNKKTTVRNSKDLKSCSRLAHNTKAIDKATGAENFAITPLKENGVIPISFTLKYNSLLLGSGDISKGFSHNYHYSSYVELLDDEYEGDVRVHWDNSNKKYNDYSFVELKNNNRIYKSNEKGLLEDELIRHDDDSFVLKRKNGSIYYYDYTKKLVSINNYKKQGVNISFTKDGKLYRVSEPISGVSLRYYYNSEGKLDRVKDRLGRLAYLRYNEKGLLSKIEFPDETDHYFFYNDNDQIYKHEVRKMVNGEKKKAQIFYLYYYDDAKVSGEEDGEDHYTHFEYKTEVEKISSTFTQEDRNKIETTYNAINLNPEHIKYPDGTTEDFTYYPNGKIKTKTNRAKHTIQYYYDPKGNMNRVVYNDGSEEQYEYDDNRNIIVKKIIDKNKKAYITRNTYDSDNNLKDTKLPNNEHITYTYNSHNQMTSKTVGGKTTKYAYYKNEDSSQGYIEGLLQSVETSEGLITSYTYDKAGRLITETNPQGGVTTYTYDAMDRVKVITNPDNKTKTFDYDMMGNKIEEKDFNGNYTKYKYDNNGNLIKKIDALNHEYKFEYDSADRLKRAYDPKGYYTEYHYDSMGRVKETIDKRGNKTTFTYDAMGNLKEEYDPYGHRLYTKTYDAKNNLIKVVDALNHTTTTDYTVFGKPSKITDPLQRVTEFKYDALGRLKKVINAKQKEATQDYNPTGILKEFTDAGKNTTTFTYDDDGNLLTTTTASGSMTQNIYEKGLLSKFINGRKDTKTFTYDKLNRVKEAKDKDGTIRFTYDYNGNLLTITENGKTATYTYDALDRVTSNTDIYGNTIRYDYDEVGNLKRLYYPDNHYIEYKYDENSNLIEVKDGNLITTFEYDKNNRLLKLTRPNKTVMTRTYNNKGQLKSQTDKTSSGEIIYSVTYDYDEAGNIKSEKRVPSLKPTLPINLTMNYKKGNLLKDANQTQAIFDDDDNMVKFGNKTFTYDSRNRLIAYNNTTYRYDSQNHRIAQTTNGKTTNGKTTTYTINPNATLSQLLELKEPNGAKTTYVYGAGLLYQQKGGKRLYYHYDLRGSTIALTDDNGNIVDRFSYLPFGKVSHDLGNTQTPFLYNGRDGVMTDTSRLYYMRARYYDPVIRRFINRDTLLGDIGKMASLNRFAYVNGNPISGVDPLGLEYTFGDAWTSTTSLLGMAGNIEKAIYGNALYGAQSFANDTFGTNVEWGGDAIVKSALEGLSDDIRDFGNSVGVGEADSRMATPLKNLANKLYKGNTKDSKAVKIIDGLLLAKDIRDLYKAKNDIINSATEMREYVNLYKNEKRLERMSMGVHRTPKAQANYGSLHLKRRNARKNFNRKHSLRHSLYDFATTSYSMICD